MKVSIDGRTKLCSPLLGREPDAAGLDVYTTDQLTLELIVRRSLNSAEFKRRFAATMVQDVHGVGSLVPAADRMYDSSYEPDVFKPVDEPYAPGR